LRLTADMEMEMGKWAEVPVTEVPTVIKCL